MNFSLVLFVLIIFIGYLLYDMFKKSRQQQELAQAQTTQKPSKSRLIPTYQNQCSILHQLHDEKIDKVKHKNISIHLQEQNQIVGLEESVKEHVKSVVKAMVQTHNVYLLVCRRKMVRNELIEAIRQAGAIDLGYDTTEGAVAVLRQLSCTTHLQGNVNLCNILLQYLPIVWLASSAKHETAFHFKNELDMVLNLELSVKKIKEMKED